MPFIQDLIRLSVSDLGESSILNVLEGLLKAIMNALEFDMRELFVALVDPLIEITIALKPLPEYQLTEYIKDGEKPMRFGDMMVIAMTERFMKVHRGDF